MLLVQLLRLPLFINILSKMNAQAIDHWIIFTIERKLGSAALLIMEFEVEDCVR